MSKKKRQKKNNRHDKEHILLITAVVSLISNLITVIGKLIELLTE